MLVPLSESSVFPDETREENEDGTDQTMGFIRTRLIGSQPIEPSPDVG